MKTSGKTINSTKKHKESHFFRSGCIRSGRSPLSAYLRRWQSMSSLPKAADVREKATALQSGETVLDPNVKSLAERALRDMALSPSVDNVAVWCALRALKSGKF